MFILQCQKVSNNRQILLQRAETGIVLIVFKDFSYYVRATIFLKDKKFKKKFKIGHEATYNISSEERLKPILHK